ncbi:8255_t:CDS:2 [Funneliformis mosseae]|uniref:8255_t:CDS:1 n=1 Tax=Funneliformis mosseae TaxID=27381 RepID=A0A9N8W4N2_FUNMO|nr:8255_t:CDS:2 [Funneliformis mosseae]
MSSNKAIKKVLKGKKIIARPSVEHRKPVGYNESLLSSYTEVQRTSNCKECVITLSMDT